jgi:hypothetical protein
MPVNSTGGIATDTEKWGGCIKPSGSGKGRDKIFDVPGCGNSTSTSMAECSLVQIAGHIK